MFWRQSRRRKESAGTSPFLAWGLTKGSLSSPPDALAGSLLKKLEEFGDIISSEAVGVWFMLGSLALDTTDIWG